METAKSALKYTKTLQLSTEAKEQALKDTTWAHVRLSYEKEAAVIDALLNIGPERSCCSLRRLFTSCPMLC
jgi:hypothetical protein